MSPKKLHHKHFIKFTITFVFLIIAVLLYFFYLSPALKFRDSLEFMASQNWEEAKDELNQMLAEGYEKVEVHNNLSVVYRNLNDFEKSLAEALKAIELDPNFKEAYFNKGYALMQQAKLDEALAAFEEAIELDENYEDALVSACEVTYVLSENDKLEGYCRRALALNKDSEEVNFVLGMFYLSKQDYLSSQEHFQKLVILDSKNALYWYLLGVNQYGFKQDDDAKYSFQKALELEPGMEDAKTMLEKLGVEVE